LDPLILIIIIGSVATMMLLTGAFFAATVVMRPRAALKKRIKDIGSAGEKSAAGAESRFENQRQKRIQDKVKQLQSKDDEQGFVDKINGDLLRAGIDVSVPVYFMGSAFAALVISIGYFVLGMPPLGTPLVFIIAFIFLPKLTLKMIANRRQEKFTRNFADAIDLIIRGIRSGLPVNECFNIVAREFEPPLGEEFRLMVEGQNLGIPLEDLMLKGIERLPTAEYKFFAIVIQIQKQTGGNLAETLAGLSSVLRERKKMRDKASAMASEAKSSAMIIGSLPFIVGLLLSVIDPEYLLLLFTTATGNKLLGFGAFWMTCGSLVMKKMINFRM